MTLGDLVTGTWTWGQLLRETVPVLLPCVFGFWAGYWRGRRVECESEIARLKRRTPTQAGVDRMGLKLWKRQAPTIIKTMQRDHGGLTIGQKVQHKVSGERAVVIRMFTESDGEAWLTLATNPWSGGEFDATAAEFEPLPLPGGGSIPPQGKD